MESEHAGEGPEGWTSARRPGPRPALAAASLAVALLLAGPDSAQAERPPDFAGCDRRARVGIADFPLEVPADGLAEAQEARVQHALERIRDSFAGCGRSPGFDWIEVRGYAAADEADPHAASRQRARAARDLLRARIGDAHADRVRFEVAIGKGAAGPAAGADDAPARAGGARVDIHLCRTFEAYHENLETIEAEDFAPYARSEDPFEAGEMRVLHALLLDWSERPSRAAAPFGRINQRFWRANGACRGEELLHRLERVRRDYYDYYIRPHAYELGRMREAGTPAEALRRTRECQTARRLLEQAGTEPSMPRIFRERLREVFAVCN